MTAPDPVIVTAGQALLGTIITGGFGVLIALIQRGNKAAKSARDYAEAVRDQVQNTHTTIMRDDIDDISTGIVELRAEVQQLGTKLEVVQASADIHHAALWQALGKPAETLPPPTPRPSLRKWFHDRTH